MIYKEYLKASQRHLQVCKCLMSRCLKNGESNNKSSNSKLSKTLNGKSTIGVKRKSSTHQEEKFSEKYILSEIYYLSGYVIECIVNYGLFYILDYDEHKDVTKLKEIEIYADGYKNIISYGSHIRGHDFQHNIKIIRGYIKENWPNSHMFLDKLWEQIQPKTSAFQNWDVKVRYEEHAALTEKNIQEFFKLYCTRAQF